jgi:predicted secreted protein with PEFG-CTERM motif
MNVNFTKQVILLSVLVLVTSFLVFGMLDVSAQQQSNPKNPCTAANPCSQQICGDHICGPGEYLKLQHELAQAQIESSMQNTTGMQNTGMQNPPSIPSTSMQNATSTQNMTGMQNTSMPNLSGIQNTTSGVSENNQAVPEFGPIASLVLVIAIVSVMVVTMKTRVSLKL